MKKKLMMVAVLLGALSLGACVDDNESASVTDLRGAKAEQLRSVAKLNEAKAEAEVIRANAEAAFKEAKAAYQQAQADMEQFELQKAQEEYALAIENIRLQYQIQLTNLQKQLLEAQNALTDAGTDRVKELFGQYFYELDKLTGYQESLVREQSQLAKLEADIISAQEWVEWNNLTLTNEIARIDAKLAVLTDEAYAGLDQTELQAQADAKEKEYNLAATAFAKDPTSVALQATVAPLNEAYAAVEEQNEYVQAIMTLARSVLDYDNSNSGMYGYAAYTAVGYDGIYLSKDVYCYVDLRIDESEKLSADRNFASYVENAKKALDLATAALGKDTDAATTKYDANGDGTAETLTAYAELAKAKADLTTANALGANDVLNGMTKPQAIQAAKNAIEAAEMTIANAKDNLAQKQLDYDKEVADQKEYNDAIAALDVDAYNTAIANYIDLCDAQDDAEEAWNDAKSVVNELYYEWRGLEYLATNNISNINEQIAALERDKADKQAQLLDQTEIVDAEIALQQANDNIAELQEKIKAQTVIVESCKTALETAINMDSDEDAPAEPETPSEEQPSEEQPAA